MKCVEIRLSKWLAPQKNSDRIDKFSKVVMCLHIGTIRSKLTISQFGHGLVQANRENDLDTKGKQKRLAVAQTL